MKKAFLFSALTGLRFGELNYNGWKNSKLKDWIQA